MDVIARLVKGDLFAVGITAGAGWVSRIFAAGAQIISIRLLADMLGVAGYGAFAVIIGLLGWFALADLGFGSGLQNYISRHRVAGEDPLMAILGVAQLLMLTTFGLWVVYAVLAWWVGPWLLSDFHAVSHSDAAWGWFAFAVLATGSGAAGIFLRVCFAEHRGYVAHAITATGALGGLGGLAVLAMINPAHPFAWSIIVYAAPNFVIPVVAMLIYLLRRRDSITMSGWIGRRILSEILASSRVFLAFNALAASVLYVDYIIISQTLSAREAAVYAITSRLFTFAFFVFNSVLQASWPVTAEIFYKGNFDRLRRTIVSCIAFGLVVMVTFSVALYLLLDPIVRILSPRDPIVVPLALIPFFAVYWIIRVWCDTFSMLVQSANGAKALLFIVPVQAVVNLTISIWAARHYGLYGLLAGMALSFVLTVAWFSPALLAYLVRRKKQALASAA